MKKIEKNIELTDSERELLLAIIKTGKRKSKEILHANILLQSDVGAKMTLTPTQIVKALNTSKQTVANVKNAYFDGGIERAVFRKKRETAPVEPKITGDIEAKIITLACNKAPDGRNRWTLRLLADKCVELQFIDSISYKSIEKVLKKHNLSLI